jgi:ParB family transcriptional regulator, chromosome partitioning protein
MNSKKKAALGRGLDALLSSNTESETRGDAGSRYVIGAVSHIRIDYIQANPFQPRTEFEKVALQELADSIRTQGIIQPVTVRKMGHDKYQLISGERRLRAAQLAGLNELPAYIRMANDNQMLEMALVENIQRSDLNAMEVSFSLQRLLEECNLTQEALADRVGKQRTTITNYLRLLKLPAEVQIAIRDGRISMGHARALINVDNDKDQIRILHDIIKNELNVRAVEKIVAYLNRGEARKKPGQRVLPEYIQEFKERVQRHFGSNIEISRSRKGKGSISIPFSSDEDLQRIMDLIDGK